MPRYSLSKADARRICTDVKIGVTDSSGNMLGEIKSYVNQECYTRMRGGRK